MDVQIENRDFSQNLMLTVDGGGKRIYQDEMDAKITTTFKLNVKHMMNARGVSQKVLAAALRMPPATLSRWITGVTSPTLVDAARVAEALGCTLVELLGDETPQPVKGPSAEDTWVLTLYHAAIDSGAMTRDDFVRRLFGGSSAPNTGTADFVRRVDLSKVKPE